MTAFGPFISQFPHDCSPGPQVKHDDLREVNAAFGHELADGKAFIADYKAQQLEALKANSAGVNEELLALTASLMQGEEQHIFELGLTLCLCTSGLISYAS